MITNCTIKKSGQLPAGCIFPQCSAIRNRSGRSRRVTAAGSSPGFITCCTAGGAAEGWYERFQNKNEHEYLCLDWGQTWRVTFLQKQSFRLSFFSSLLFLHLLLDGFIGEDVLVCMYIQLGQPCCVASSRRTNGPMIWSMRRKTVNNISTGNNNSKVKYCVNLGRKNKENLLNHSIFRLDMWSVDLLRPHNLSLDEQQQLFLTAALWRLCFCCEIGKIPQTRASVRSF